MRGTVSRMMRTPLLLALTFITLTLLMPGCGDGRPDAGFTFITSNEHFDLEPQQISWLHDSRLVQMMYEPLVEVDYQTMQVHPGVAERWKVSDDGTVYTFHLRDAARWSNGDKVTADDFIFAWRRAMLPDLAANYTKLMYHIEGAEDFFAWRKQQLARFDQLKQQSGDQAAQKLWAQTMERFDENVGLAAPDDQTLVVTLERPVPYFLSLAGFTTFLPVHRASVEPLMTLDAASGMRRVADGKAGYWSDPQRLITNGPYQMVGRRFQQHVRLKKNPRYWDSEAVQTEIILERIINDPQNALMTYNSGGADFWPDVPSGTDMAADLVQQDRNDVHTQRMAAVYFYNFNCRETLPNGRDNPLANPKLRRALSMAINRETIVKRVTRLNQPIARTYVPGDALPDYDPPTEAGVTFNPERAKALLAEAGHPNGEGLDQLSILYNTGSGHGIIAEAVQQMWQQHLGVTVSLEERQGKAFGTQLEEGNFTIARASWFGDYPDPTTWLAKMSTGSGNNDCGWSNPEFDALLEKAEGETDPQRRMQLLRDAEALLLKEQPMAMMYQYVNVYLWDPQRVDGLEANKWARWRFTGVRVGSGE